jgi:hypothetical protein
MMSLVVAHARRCNTALRVICNCTGFGGSFPQSAARHRASACLQAAYFGTQAALRQPSTQPFNCHPRRRGLPPLIGRPNQEASAPQPRSMLCTPGQSFVSWRHHTSTRLHHHHEPSSTTPSSFGCVPRAGSGRFGFPSSPSFNTSAQHTGAFCTTTWDLRTFNQRILFYFLSCLSDDIDIKCYDISGTSWDRKGLGNCTTTMHFVTGVI